MQKIALNQAYATALVRWQTPFPGFTSGHDPRTSDNALLVQFYGGLEHASRHEWLNAGRRLIDKTYIDMLWHVQELTAMRACRPKQIAAALDGFIQETVAPVWHRIPAMSREEKLALAAAWVSDAAGQLFGSLHSELAASRLLFVLCPMLPVYNLSRGHSLTLDHMGHKSPGDSYRAYSEAAEAAYERLAPTLRALPPPVPSTGWVEEQSLIRQLLGESDWWPGRVFDELLRQSRSRENGRVGKLYGCDDAGRLADLEMDVP